MAGAMPARMIPTFHYTPFFSFRFFPTGLRVLQTGPSLCRYPNFAHTGHLHAFLRRHNTTTTWFGSRATPLQAVADMRQNSVQGLTTRTTEGPSGLRDQQRERIVGYYSLFPLT